MDDEQEEELTPTFRIRFTISSGRSSQNDSPRNESSNDYNSDPSSYACEENGNQKCNSETGSNNSVCNKPNCKEHRKRAFKLIQPQNHKSSLFVSLSDTSRDSSPQQGEQNHLFVSPDLDHYIPASPPSPATTLNPFESGANRTTNPGRRSLDDSTMSHGCNFINWSSASRRRSSSVTRSNNAQPPGSDEKGRRASSSHDLAAPVNPLATKSPSGNHLSVGMSNETICDHTTTNRPTLNHRSQFPKHSSINHLQPLDIQIDVPSERCLLADIFDHHQMAIDSADDPINLDDVLQVDLDSPLVDLHLEHACRLLESQVQKWEDIVDELERDRHKYESRSLVDKLIQEKKRVRDLDFQLFKAKCRSERSSGYKSQRLSPISATNLAASKFGSQIKPGQENTADILDAIPPSGPLQHKQYLTKASSGTDSSEYSRVPSVNKHHRHPLPGHKNWRSTCESSDDSTNEREAPLNELLAYVPIIDSAIRFSPIRPNHFNAELRSNQAMVSEDSSSPASGDNTQ